jgi:hypothetical protein
MSKSGNRSAIAGLRLVAALAVVPFAAGTVMFLTYLALWFSGARVFEGPPFDLKGAVHAAAGLALGVTIIGFAVTGVAVLPLVWMGSRGPLSLKNVLFLGAALGNVPFAVIVVAILLVQLRNGSLSSDVPRLWYGLYGAVRAIALGFWIGISSAAVFWVIGVRGTESDEGSGFFGPLRG